MSLQLVEQDHLVERRQTAIEKALGRAGSDRAAVLQLKADELARYIRLEGSRKPHPGVAGRAGLSWLRATFGEQDDCLKRAAVAALAAGLARRVDHLPGSVRKTYSLAQERLGRTLGAGRPYRADFDRDIALASALAVWIGPFNVILPEPGHIEPLAVRSRRAVMRSVRYALHFGLGEARCSLVTSGLRPWLELHLDARALAAFNTQGLVDGYHVVADLLRGRPDVAGLYGGSWLYDPRVSAISPELAFVRRTAEDGGARIVRMRCNPVQVHYAVARSGKRRQLMESGEYRPACYGMYWASSELIRWSECVQQGRSAPIRSHRQWVDQAPRRRFHA